MKCKCGSELFKIEEIRDCPSCIHNGAYLFTHPKQAVYLLGAEDHGLPDEVQEQCNKIVSLEAITMPSYNVAVAGSIVMYHRQFIQKQMIFAA